MGEERGGELWEEIFKRAASRSHCIVDRLIDFIGQVIAESSWLNFSLNRKLSVYPQVPNKQFQTRMHR